MRNIFFLPDSTYTDKIIKYSEAAYPGNNVYLFLQVLPGNKIKFIKDERIKIVACDLSSVLEVLGDATQYKSIHIHYLTQFNAFIVEKLLIIKRFTLIWYLWGGDFYTLPYFRNKIYDANSGKFATVENYDLRNRIKHSLKDFVGRPNRYVLFRILEKIDYCISSIPHDILLAREVLKRDFKTMDFSFLSLENLIDAKSESHFNEGLSADKVIMIGNSGDPSNNHLTVFKSLSKLNIKSQIVTPLAYGNKAYIEEVVKWGNFFFKDKFTPLAEFLKYDLYLEILRDTGVAIFNHQRQQAVGNILTLLWLGKKVFINRNTTVFKSLSSWDIKVYATEEISDMSESVFFQPLSTSDISRTRRVLEDRFSAGKVLSYYQNILEV